MSDTDLHKHLNDPRRLAELQAVALLDTPTEEAFDRLSRLAARFTMSPVALVSLVTAKRQFFKSCIGLPEPWNSLRETPLSHSFCQHNRVSGRPLIIKDAREHPTLKNHPAIQELGIIAYLGFPLVTSDSYILGSFCVIDSKPRIWSQTDIETVRDLAFAVMTEIELRTEVNELKKVKGDRDKLSSLYSTLQNETKARKRAEEERKNLEIQLAQTQKMEAIGALAGGIAHDFNNILMPLLGYVELALEALPSDCSATSYIKKVYQSGIRARDLVKQILTFSRQEKQVLKPIKIQLVIKEALKLLRATIPSTIEIKQNIFADCGLVMADPTQIHQIIMNLCTNAYHSMRESGGTMTVTLDQVEVKFNAPENKMNLRPGHYGRVKIIDTGCGMDVSTKERIFEPYFTNKKKGEGTGLGLAIVHGIIKSYDGGISVSSEIGHGTTISVYLPIIAETEIEIQTYDDALVPKGTERILLVDDEEPIIKMVKLMLDKLGYEIIALTNSIDALETFRRKPDHFDVVITDMTMPYLTGDRLSMELKKIRQDIPIIICSGFSEIMNEEKAAKVGAMGFLTKPVLMKDLSKKIREVLERKE